LAGCHVLVAVVVDAVEAAGVGLFPCCQGSRASGIVDALGAEIGAAAAGAEAAEVVSAVEAAAGAVESDEREE